VEVLASVQSLSFHAAPRYACMKHGGISRSLSPPIKTWNENENWCLIIFSLDKKFLP
jgi:hypothetical protein